MDNKDTAKATKQPMASANISVEVIVLPSRKNMRILYPLVPTMVGIARKKVNSAAAVREMQRSNAPKIVMPEREVPGIHARIWKQPIKKAFFQEICATSVMVASSGL